MEKYIKDIENSINTLEDKEKVKIICEYASDSFDKVIILGMKKIDTFEEYRILGNYKDDKDIVWNLEAAKISILNQTSNH